MADRIRTTLPDIIRRFEERIVPGENGCWIWTGPTNRPDDGYGTLNLVGSRKGYAHRWSYEYHRAPIPEGLEIDHLCRNKLCVNPWHLEPVTRIVNARRIPYGRKAYCKWGHERTPENLYDNGNCRPCRLEYRSRVASAS